MLMKMNLNPINGGGIDTFHMLGKFVLDARIPRAVLHVA